MADRRRGETPRHGHGSGQRAGSVWRRSGRTVGHGTSADGTSADGTSADGTSTDGTPADGTPGRRSRRNGSTGYGTPGRSRRNGTSGHGRHGNARHGGGWRGWSDGKATDRGLRRMEFSVRSSRQGNGKTDA